jgi:type IV secretion system protein VirB1
MIVAALLACAMNVAPVTLDAIVRAESGGNPIAINVNHLVGPQPHAVSAADAAALTRRYIAAGYSVDIGLMQVNSRDLAALGYTIEDALDPCRSISGGAAILAADYSRAVQQFGEGQRALLAALSAYNTGDFYRGFGNGYVSRVAGIPTMSRQTPTAATPANPYTATTVAYSREDLHVRIE